MRNVIILFVVFGAAIAGAELLLNRGSDDGTFLLVITFFTMIVQGCIALAAVGEVAKGLWLIPVKRDLLSLYPLLFFVALLYPLLAMRMDIYAWTEHPNAWLNIQFFVVRNFVILFVVAWVGRLLAHAVMSGNEKKNTYAVFYILLFVTSQSLVAFDWIMSLEYPWISTLFGGHFFIQAFLLGLLTTSFIIFFRVRGGDTGLTETLRDTGKMTFGFCFLWGGFFFAQYITIWYGNIPEEVDYVFKRVDPAPYWGLSRAVLAMIFIIPFVSLFSRKLKVFPPGMVVVATIAAAGILLEKVVLIRPVTPINPVATAAELALALALMVLVYRARESYMPQQLMEGSAAGPSAPPSGELTSSH